MDHELEMKQILISWNQSEQIIDSTVPDIPISNDRVSKTNISLDVVFQEIQEVKGILLNHVHSTSEAFAGIRHEIVGIKNVCKVRSQAVESKVENITESTVALKKELSNVSTTLKSQLQSITDRIGSSQLKKDNDNKTSRSNSGTMSNKTSTSTNNVNEYVHVDSLRAEKPMPNKLSDHNRSKPTKGRVLLIGSSILQRVNKKGLSRNVDVSTNPGALAIKLEITRNNGSFTLQCYSNPSGRQRFSFRKK